MPNVRAASSCSSRMRFAETIPDRDGDELAELVLAGVAFPGAFAVPGVRRTESFFARVRVGPGLAAPAVRAVGLADLAAGGSRGAPPTGPFCPSVLSATVCPFVWPTGPGVDRPTGPGVDRPTGPGVDRPVGPGADRPAGPGADRPAGGQSARAVTESAR
jgi:hypothetical protein